MKDIKDIKKVYFVGIGGSAISAVAKMLHLNGIEVLGSDMQKSGMSQELEDMGIRVFYSQVKENIANEKVLPDLIITTPAVKHLNKNNEEILFAEEKNIEVRLWQEFLGSYLFTTDKIGLMTSGSEGKGTTCGILAWLLKDTSYDPFMILGANLKDINGDKKATNIYLGKGNSFIIEADEFDRNFHNYHPDIVMMVNFSYEHPEVYKDFNEYKESFFKFYEGMKGAKTLIFRATKNMVEFVKEYGLQKTHHIIWYRNENDEFTVECDYVVKDVKLKKEKNGITFMLDTPQGIFGFELNSLPFYLANNAAASIICALELGLDPQTVWEKIRQYKGFERRFEVFKFKDKGTIITDYGHSPTSIRQIIKEVRNIFPDKKLHLIFQPHLFSRTYNFLDEFVEELKKADKVSLVDIYPAREKKEEWDDRVSSRMLNEKLLSQNVKSEYIGDSQNVHEALNGKILEDEVSVFMGAGDMDKSYKKLISNLGGVN